MLDIEISSASRRTGMLPRTRDRFVCSGEFEYHRPVVAGGKSMMLKRKVAYGEGYVAMHATSWSVTRV